MFSLAAFDLVWAEEMDSFAPLDDNFPEIRSKNSFEVESILGGRANEPLKAPNFLDLIILNYQQHDFLFQQLCEVAKFVELPQIADTDVGLVP